MSEGDFNSWQSVQAEVLRRINAREWKPGEFIPNEAELAIEFNCARATVNRALRALAETGLIDRRRKAGTRVALHPVRKATLAIPVIRYEIEGNGQSYRHTLLTSTHEGGAQVVITDGSVRFLSENIDFGTMTRLCDRADNQPLGEY